MSLYSRLQLALRRRFYALTRKQGGSDKYRYAAAGDAASDSEAYKQLLGGGSEKWEQRGAFQLHFLEQYGLKPGHRLLDVGCGPLRAGLHLIPRLDVGNYYGIDYNHEFIRIAEQQVAGSEIASKQPTLAVVEDFDFPLSFPLFDYVMVFSVLNHCTEEQKKAFFNHIDRVTAPCGLVCISHGAWFLDAYLGKTGLVREHTLGREDLDLERWGWTDANQKRTFPILILRRQ
jgi:SAM-dependent methyltransferase